MTSTCANPACKAPFRYFRSGTIYLLDKRDGVSQRATLSMKKDGIEYFWLCGECARTMRMVLDRKGVAILERSGLEQNGKAMAARQCA